MNPILHWKRAWSELELHPPAGLLEQLLAAYAEPQRHYHTHQHLTECLLLLDTARSQTTHAGALAIALWFHDAIYDVHAQDNEARSAQWAVQALQAAGAAPCTQAQVHDLILATAHTAQPAPGDAQLLVDIDLAILGASPARFAQYVQQIRQEYAWVPDALYAQRRTAVLEQFAQRARIYNTEWLYAQREAQARANLQSALHALS